jgi:dUTP pyrophosphatase
MSTGSASDGTVKVRVRRLDSAAALPAYAHPGDAGLDLSAAEAVTLEPGARALVPTGIAVALPAGYAGLVMPRSGLAARHGVTVLNAPGLIDAGYRGEIKVLLINHGPDRVTLARGDRVAQLVVAPVAHARLEPADDLPNTERGGGGFGSSGR